MLVPFIPELPVEETPAPSIGVVAGWDLETGKCDKNAGRLTHVMDGGEGDGSGG